MRMMLGVVGRKDLNINVSFTPKGSWYFAVTQSFNLELQIKLLNVKSISGRILNSYDVESHPVLKMYSILCSNNYDTVKPG
jgi:hypothetical protein